MYDLHMESASESPITRIREILDKAIFMCHEEVTDSEVFGYSDKQKKKWNVPTSGECKRLEALHRQMFSGSK